MKHFFLVLFFLLFALPVQALTGEWQQLDQAAMRFIAATGVDGTDRLVAGVQLTLKPGWDSYWRSPGDAGLPPVPDWRASQNLASANLLFPWPERFMLQGFETYGYKDQVVFPVRLKKQDATKPLALNMAITLLTCSDICVPAAFNIHLDIPADYKSPEAGDEATALLKRFYARTPKQDDGQGLSLQSAQWIEAGGKNKLQLALKAAQPMEQAEVIVEVGDGSILPVTATEIAPDKTRVEATVGSKVQKKDVEGKEFIFTLIDKTHQSAVEKKLTVGEGGAASATAPTAPTAPAKASLLVILLFAFIGGLILNLMPCVLPVLAIKSLSFISHGGGSIKGVRLSFLATSAGILFSFLLMALAIIGVKQVGMSVGWGVQFQNPYFLMFLIAVLLVFGANLWGFFEINLPRFMADKLSWTQGHGSLAKDFFSGAFATLLATPCSAPFLGTAVGFALASGSLEILAVFIALGLGLATPFLLIAAFPKTATLLPKPGKWMNGFKRFLAMLLLLTAGWLLLVLTGLYQQATHAADDLQWQVFDESKIAGYVAEGDVVLVDVTADWCLTCQVNKKLVLSSDVLKKMLIRKEVILMKADWTKPDETIAAYLQKFGRFGIPFNKVYGPKAPMGIMLPELLSKDVVLQGLVAAGLNR